MNWVMPHTMRRGRPASGWSADSLRICRPKTQERGVLSLQYHSQPQFCHEAVRENLQKRILDLDMLPWVEDSSSAGRSIAANQATDGHPAPERRLSVLFHRIE
jgi:hypothetical protein